MSHYCLSMPSVFVMKNGGCIIVLCWCQVSVLLSCIPLLAIVW